jgi:para-nitrobenzyl esterase
MIKNFVLRKHIYVFLFLSSLPVFAMLASASLALAQANSSGGNPIVSTGSGQLRGSVTPDGIAVFKNIPFAQPPVGDLRWKEPSPAKAWTGVRDATAFGLMCHQNDNKQLPHSEDCLQLNVWTAEKWPMKVIPARHGLVPWRRKHRRIGSGTSFQR